ncbi:MAG: cation diffusion facilitator family transporter [Thermoplasmatota archaeon]
MGLKRGDNLEDKIEILKESEKAAFLTTITTLLLAVGKGLAGLLSGNLVLLTDGVHSAADILPIFASWFGLKIAQREPDEKFPYGYYKAESLASLFVSIFIIYIAIEFTLEGFSKLFEVSSVSHPIIAGGVAFSSIFISFLIAKYQKQVGEKTNSQSLITNSKESMMDVLSSVLVFVAIALSYLEVRYVEGAVTMLIALMIFKVGFESIKDSAYALMDISPSEGVEESVVEVIGNISGVEGYQNLKLRKSGPFVFGEVTVKVRKSIDVDRAHEISENLENKLKDKLKTIDSFTTHIEPYKTTKSRIALPIKTDEGITSELSDKFGRAPYFIIVSLDTEKKKIEDWEVKENKFEDKEVRAGLNAANLIVKEKIDSLITKEIGKISFHTLRDHIVDVYKCEDDITEDLVEKYLSDELKKLSEPTKDKD